MAGKQRLVFMYLMCSVISIHLHTGFASLSQGSKKVFKTLNNSSVKVAHCRAIGEARAESGVGLG
jgi:hypothetical protein